MHEEQEINSFYFMRMHHGHSIFRTLKKGTSLLLTSLLTLETLAGALLTAVPRPVAAQESMAPTTIVHHTSLPHTGSSEYITENEDVTIGELVTYATIIRIPADAFWHDVVVTNSAPTSFQLERAWVLSADHLVILKQDKQPHLFDRDQNGMNDTAIFDFDGIRNKSNGVQDLVIAVTALVINDEHNVNGATPVNTVEISYEELEGPPFMTIVPVDIVEPRLQIEQSVSQPFGIIGEEFLYTIVLGASPQSHADAFYLDAADVVDERLSVQDVATDQIDNDDDGKIDADDPEEINSTFFGTFDNTPNKFLFSYLSTGNEKFRHLLQGDAITLQFKVVVNENATEKDFVSNPSWINWETWPYGPEAASMIYRSYLVQDETTLFVAPTTPSAPSVADLPLRAGTTTLHGAADPYASIFFFVDDVQLADMSATTDVNGLWETTLPTDALQAGEKLGVAGVLDYDHDGTASNNVPGDKFETLVEHKFSATAPAITGPILGGATTLAGVTNNQLDPEVQQDFLIRLYDGTNEIGKTITQNANWTITNLSATTLHANDIITATATIDTSNDGKVDDNDVASSLSAAVVVSAQAARLQKNIPDVALREDESKAALLQLGDYFIDTDPDDTQTYSLLDGFSASLGTLTIQQGGTVDIQLAANAFGKDTVQFRATDRSGLSVDSNVITLDVAAVNDTPMVNAGKDQNVSEDATVTLDASASTDVDSTTDIATYAWGESLDSADACSITQANSIKPTVTVGNRALNFTCTYKLTVMDVAGATSTDDVVISVTADNDTPVFDNFLDQRVVEGGTVIIKIRATDLDSTLLSLRALDTSGEFAARGLNTANLFVTTQDNSGTFTWTPGLNDAGTYHLTFSASDGITSTTKKVTITVDESATASIASTNIDVAYVEGTEAGKGIITLYDDNDQPIRSWRAFSEGGVRVRLAQASGQTVIVALKVRSGTTIHVYDLFGNVLDKTLLTKKLHQRRLAIANVNKATARDEIVVTTKHGSTVNAKIFTMKLQKKMLQVAKAKAFEPIKKNAYRILIHKKKIQLKHLRHKKTQQSFFWSPQFQA